MGSELTGRLDFAESLALVLAVVGAVVGFVGWAVARALAERKRATRARVAAAGASELRDGPAVVVGAVRTDGDEPAIRIRLTEHAKEHRGKRRHHVWTEQSRDVEVRPFVLETARGERVSVEPTKEVFLVDLLEVTAQPERAKRERTATLSAGERVSIVGTLERRGASSAAGAYRGDSSWILRPTGTERMLVSTEPLHARHDRWARFFAISAFVGILVGGGLLTFLHGTFIDLVITGHATTGRVVSHHHYTTRGRRGRTTQHWQLSIVTSGPNGQRISFRDEIPVEAFDQLVDGASVPCVVSREGRGQLGAEPGVEEWSLLILAMMLGSFAFFFYYARRGRRAWYEMDRVVTVVNGGLP